MRRDRHAVVAGAFLVLPLISGCGRSRAAPFAGMTIPVRGTVHYKGQPLTGGSITFEPDGGREAHSSIGPDGSFQLTTFQNGDGAVPGTHRVAVTGQPRLPMKYRNLSSSGVEVEVAAGTQNYPIELP